MELRDLAENLGYTGSSGNWITEPDPSDHLLRKAWKAGAQGAYRFCTSADKILPPRPAVLVASALSEGEARSIHRRLWNLGNCPFVIVVLPHQVRVYRGFRYHSQNERDDLIASPLSSESELGEALMQFHAEEIDSGRIWESQSANLSLDTRVDHHLLKNLNHLGNELVGSRGMDEHLAHALIGQYIYIHYLRHRGILSDGWLEQKGVDLDEVIGRRATTRGLLSLVDVLEERFNGQIFPIDSSQIPDDSVVSYVASVFRGDCALSGQTVLDFAAYDFSYIPVELLSAIYEQFLRRSGKSKDSGAVYTPEPLADYVLREINSIRPLSPGMRILDPCCGSGIFLVLAYRWLIELARMKRPGNRLTPMELSNILTKGIYGVETDSDACRVSEFSLILTLLDYVQPPDLDRHERFRFPVLRDNNIFCRDFFDGGLPVREKGLRFDWVVGNPPWKELNPGKPENDHAVKWIRQANDEGKCVASYRICEAFTWGVGEFLKRDGYAGLVTHAKSLVNDESEGYRRAFFQRHKVLRITNFSNLAYILFDHRAEAPAATMVYTTSHPGEVKPAITHYGPFVANQVQSRSAKGQRGRTWSLAICENEIRSVEAEEAECGRGETWKLALWGMYRDDRAIQRLRCLFPKTLKALCKERGWTVAPGLQFGDPTGRSEKYWYESRLAALRVLDTKAMRRSGYHFSVPDFVLGEIPEAGSYIRQRGGAKGLLVAFAPHIYWSPDFVAYSDADFVLRNPRIGVAAGRADADLLRAVSVWLNSAVLDYILFFQSGSWGADRTKLVPADVLDTPIPDLSSDQVKRLAALHRELALAESAPDQVNLFTVGTDERREVPDAVRLRLRDRLNREIGDVLGIPKGIDTLAREFWEVRYQLNKGKTGGRATSPPSKTELALYASALRDELDGFSGVRHHVVIHEYSDMIVCTLTMTSEKCCMDTEVSVHRRRVQVADHDLAVLLGEQFSQWVYIQRGLRMFDGHRIHVCKGARLMDWTETQARLDADDIVCEVLSQMEVAS